jgi:hypothetical protein
MDKQKEESLVRGAAVACVVLGNPVTGQYTLVDLDDAPMSEESIQDAKSRGFEFVGVMGIKDGVADAMCEPGPGALSLMCCAVLPFVTRYAAKLGPKSDGADWLEQLHALPDPREN